MKKTTWLSLSILLASCAKPEEIIKKNINESDFKPAIEYLASDELLGRALGSEGVHKAADYLSQEFEKLGLNHAPGLTSYKQNISFYNRPKAVQASIVLNSKLKITLDDFFARSGKSAQFSAKSIVVDSFDENKATSGAYKDAVIINKGSKIEKGVMNFLTSSDELKMKFEEAGAKAYVEVLPEGFAWKNYFGYFAGQILMTEVQSSIPHICVVLTDAQKKLLKSEKAISFAIEMEEQKPIDDANVVAYLPGNDAKLRDEFVLVTAHYDHVGYKTGAKADEDSIFNGARDNAVGAVALLAGAKVLKKLNPKRSVLFVALTGEEKGLLGSKYYAENPVLPLEKTFFNLNLDGAGYNDTSIVTFVGLDYYKQDSLLIKPLEAMGLTYHPDPDPKLNLFVRSDNISFSNKGVPSATFSLGFNAFDETINAYYHQPSDEADDLDYGYIERFYESFSNVLYTLTIMPEQLQFKEDKAPFAEKQKALYQDK
ncbi:M28 family peptidase [bacterium]|nr:MAG: M28 family peptidase [bacterium]